MVGPSLSYQISLPCHLSSPRKDDAVADMGKSKETEAKDCTGFWEKTRSSAGIPSENKTEFLGPLATEDISTSRENSGQRGSKVNQKRPEYRGFDE